MVDILGYHLCNVPQQANLNCGSRNQDAGLLHQYIPRTVVPQYPQEMSFQTPW